MGFLKKITKPFTRVLDKIIPNEVKPFLPYVAAAVPFVGGFQTGIFSGAKGRALLSGLSSAVASGAEEGSEGIDFKTALMSAGLGYLADPTAADKLRGMKTFAGDYAPARTGLQKAKDFGLDALIKGSEFLSKPSTGFKDLAGKYAVTAGVEGAGQAMRYTEREAKAQQEAIDAYNAMVAANKEASYNEYYDEIIDSMLKAGFSQTEADEAAEEVLSNFGVFKKGGIVSFKNGGDVTPPGMEMDLRGGGFIPIGKYEKADDVKARVGLNEFVMTADAVRGMGNGDVRAGARKMYQLMNKLEPVGRMTS
mgnify:CR=1 FL=1